jgi:formylmethanofuran dehydrogenase subunit B
MCIYGIFKDDLGFYYFQGRETTRFLKIQVIVNMPPLKNPKQIDVFNGMALFYKCFIKNFDAIMALITKLNRKTKTFLRRAFCTEIT